MHFEQFTESLVFHLRNIALFSFDQDKEYDDIISPFSRLYLITEGNGYLNIGNSSIELEAGNLYLIPSFTPCTYHFKTGLSHIYIHLSIDQNNGLSPFNLYSYVNKVKANELDYLLFKRLLELNPGLQLPHDHPNVYQTKMWLTKKVSYVAPGQHIETIGILEQLFSRFVVSGQSRPVADMLKFNIQSILMHIQNNLHHDIFVKELAEMACLSKDHFSKVFKSITGMAPCDYIIHKRIERAQFLLITTDLSHDEIIEQTGFRSTTYFSRIFKLNTSCTPEKYRKLRG